jgi:cation-transporting ATPase E
MRDILRIFLTRVLYAALVIAAVAAIEGGFPLTPKQNALLTLITVGIPSLFLAAWAPAERIAREDLGAGLARMVVPAGWTIAVAAFLTYVTATLAPGHADVTAQAVAQSALTTMCVLCGLIFFVFVDDAAGPGRLGRRHRPRIALAALLLIAYAIVLAVPGLAASFDLVTPNAAEVLALAAGAAVWILTLRWLLRVRALDVLLGIPGAPGSGARSPARD